MAISVAVPVGAETADALAAKLTERVAELKVGPSLAEVELVLPPSLSTSKIRELRDLLIEHVGQVPVTLQVRLPDRTVWIAPRDTFKVQFGPELAASLEGILGQGSVHERYHGLAN